MSQEVNLKTAMVWRVVDLLQGQYPIQESLLNPRKQLALNYLQEQIWGV